ncbi:MAG: response regulator [Gammaproteobacteria bacterium]|nr:response regulator [Gammaproteobacteria bacterium]
MPVKLQGSTQYGLIMQDKPPTQPDTPVNTYTDNKPLILCVDDEPINIVIMEELLGEKYRLALANNGFDCFEIARTQIPDLILLDVNMPGIDGLETCAQIRDNPETAGIPVIFVSALATEPELMAGYEAGGDDYITKPFSEEILQRKIEIVLEAESRKQKLQDITDNVVQVLIANKGGFSELDMVVNFLQDCSGQTDFQGLSKAVFTCLGYFELDSSLLFLVEPEPLFWFSDDVKRPMEEHILLSLNNQDRVVRFGRRLAINSQEATLLIRKMPDDPERATRLTEYLSILVEALDAKIKSMAVQAQLNQYMAGARQTGEKLGTHLKAAKVAHRKHKSKVARMVARLDIDISQVIDKQQLSKTQGRALTHIVQRFEVQTEKIEQGRQTARQDDEQFFSDLIKSLKS